MKKFLRKIGLPVTGYGDSISELNGLVFESFRQKRGKFSEEEVDHLFNYKVPQLSPDGSCSLKNAQPVTYSLRNSLGLPDKINKLRTSSESFWLWHLNILTNKLFSTVSPDWLGIYKKIIKKNGEAVLVKLAYKGEISRAEFPLTNEFAAHSNNSTVGLKGKAVVVQSVSSYQGPYYVCDGRVESEFCCPVIKDDHIAGIIDAESFQRNYFSPPKLLEIAKVCLDLSGYL